MARAQSVRRILPRLSHGGRHCPTIGRSPYWNENKDRPKNGGGKNNRTPTRLVRGVGPKPLAWRGKEAHMVDRLHLTLRASALRAMRILRSTRLARKIMVGGCWSVTIGSFATGVVTSVVTSKLARLWENQATSALI